MKAYNGKTKKPAKNTNQKSLIHLYRILIPTDVSVGIELNTSNNVITQNVNNNEINKYAKL